LAGFKYKINDEIKATQVRIVQMQDESANGIFTLQEAMALAESLEKDLVEIVPMANPPVCRITDLSKLLYEEKKKDRERKHQQKQAEMKEIRFGPQTDDHDFDFKTKHAEEFLAKGHKVRAFVFFRGRSIVYKDIGYKLLEKFAKHLEGVGKIESPPRMEGKKLFVTMVPKNFAIPAAPPTPPPYQRR
jgi:translation initiation factor IF-3